MSFLRLIPGWIIIAWLIYYYVYNQYELIQSPLLLMFISIVGLVFSFLFSSSEMAIAECGANELEELQTMATEINEQLKVEPNSEKTYRKEYYIGERKKILQLQDFINNSDRYNPSIVIGNNIANVAIAALLPQALKSPDSNPEIPFTLGEADLVKDYLGLESLPFTGIETLTFFSAVLAIIVFGEIIPKRLASQNSLSFIRRLRWFIMSTRITLGWLGNSFASFGTPLGWKLTKK